MRPRFLLEEFREVVNECDLVDLGFTGMISLGKDLEVLYLGYRSVLIEVLQTLIGGV